MSLVIVSAVMMPDDAAPNAGFAIARVATAVPGAAAVPLRRKTSFAVVLRVESTRSATVLRKATGWVTAMIYLLSRH